MKTNKLKVCELTGVALDWAVAQDEGLLAFGYRKTDRLIIELSNGELEEFCPSTDWAQGGPIIEREKITLEWTGENWCAYIRHDEEEFGTAPLIAAMRCYVASKLGDEIEIPEELQ